MIEFLPGNRVKVYTEQYGEKTFHMAPIEKGQRILDYMDLIMDTYWHLVGKNSRIYNDPREVSDGDAT